MTKQKLQTSYIPNNGNLKIPSREEFHRYAMNILYESCFCTDHPTDYRSCTNKNTKRKVNSSGIYCIHNIKNNKRYIGQSRHMRDRISQHKSKLNNNHHNNKHLQRAWNKYGEESFKFEIICECPTELLDENEIYFIDFYDSYNNGYNNDRGGSTNNKMPMPIETRGKISSRKLNISDEEKIINRKKNIVNHLFESDEIYQVDFNCNIINIWSSDTNVYVTHEMSL